MANDPGTLEVATPTTRSASSQQLEGDSTETATLNVLPYSQPKPKEKKKRQSGFAEGETWVPAQYKNPWSESSEQDIAALPAGRQLRERPSAALAAKPPPPASPKQQRQRSPSKSNSSPTKSKQSSSPAKPDTSLEVLRVREYVPNNKRPRESLRRRESSDLCVDVSSTVRPTVSHQPSMEPSPDSPHQRDIGDAHERPPKRLKPDSTTEVSSMSPQPAPAPAPKLSFKLTKTAQRPEEPVGTPEASSSTASPAAAPSAPPPPATKGQEPISDFKRHELESRNRAQAQAQAQQLTKKPSAPQIRPGQTASSSSSSTPKAQPTPQANPGPKTSSALLQHLGGRHKPSPAPAAAPGSRPGTPAASGKVAADNGVKPSASHLPSAKALGKQQQQQQQSNAPSDQQQPQPGNGGQPVEATGVAAPSTPGESAGEKPKRKEVNGLAKLMRPNALSGKKLTFGKKTDSEKEVEQSASQESLDFNQFNTNKRLPTADEEAQRQSEESARSMTDYMRSDHRGMPKSEYESIEKQRADALRERELREKDDLPFDLLDQNNIFLEYGDLYKRRINFLMQLFKDEPVKGRYTDAFVERYNNTYEDEAPLVPQKDDIVYDPVVFPVRPGTLGAFFRNHNRIELFDPREEEYHRQQKEKEDQANNHSKYDHPDASSSMGQTPNLEYGGDSTYGGTPLPGANTPAQGGSAWGNSSAKDGPAAAPADQSGSAWSRPASEGQADWSLPPDGPSGSASDPPPAGAATPAQPRFPVPVLATVRGSGQVAYEAPLCHVCNERGHVSTSCEKSNFCVLCGGSHLLKNCHVKRSFVQVRTPCFLCNKSKRPALYHLGPHCRADCQSVLHPCMQCLSRTHMTADCMLNELVFRPATLHAPADVEMCSYCEGKHRAASLGFHTRSQCVRAPRCFRCNEPSHHHDLCPKIVSCRYCHQQGHLMSDCRDARIKAGAEDTPEPASDGASKAQAEASTGGWDDVSQEQPEVSFASSGMAPSSNQAAWSPPPAATADEEDWGDASGAGPGQPVLARSPVPGHHQHQISAGGPMASMSYQPAPPTQPRQWQQQPQHRPRGGGWRPGPSRGGFHPGPPPGTGPAQRSGPGSGPGSGYGYGYGYGGPAPRGRAMNRMGPVTPPRDVPYAPQPAAAAAVVHAPPHAAHAYPSYIPEQQQQPPQPPSYVVPPPPPPGDLPPSPPQRPSEWHRAEGRDKGGNEEGELNY